MRLNEVDFDAAPPIDAYGPGFFRVAGEVHEGPTLMFAGGPEAWAGLPDIAPILARADEIDVLFLGIGAEIAHLDPALKTPLEEAGIGVEVMATPAACRTYNVLLSEGRRIAAALMPV